MASFKFVRADEKRPQHGESIIWFNPTSFYGLEFAPKQNDVEYQWEEIDSEDGIPTGTSYVYNGEESLPNCRLSIIVGGFEMRDNCLWASSDEIFEEIVNSLHENEK